MHFHVITLFPDLIENYCSFGVLSRAIEKGFISYSCWNPRDYAEDKRKTVDDRPYGGGPGMLMKVQPLAAAIRDAKRAAREGCKVIYLSPQGRRVTQADIADVAEGADDIIFVAGRYEGIDERLIDSLVDEEWSIGDFVVSGGEVVAMAMIDATARMVPGVLGHEESADQDSFMQGLLDHPHYTRPEEVEGKSVPEVLLHGDHDAIRRWRTKQALGRTWIRRPDLIQDLELDKEQIELLSEFKREHQESDKHN